MVIIITMWLILFTSFFTLHDALALRNQTYCSPNEIVCNDGACVRLESREECTDDNHIDCDLITENACQDFCIDIDGECDKATDCPDRGDDEHVGCYVFRTMYYGIWRQNRQGLFRCEDGKTIENMKKCDGTYDCADRSDEIPFVCSRLTCPQYDFFRCAYGACIDIKRKCDGVRDCLDGSDETYKVCSKLEGGYRNPVQCGEVTAQGTALIINGQTAEKGELPWHVGIYTKSTTPYMQICGGSIVSPTLVISAAHCFYDTTGLLPSENFAIAAGKIYRPWNNDHDDSQQRDVRDIKIPDRYIGMEGNFQSDIALVIVSLAFEYKVHIRPVCLNFDAEFNNQQLFSGNLGKVAGWGLTSENGKESQILKVAKMPYVTVSDCQEQIPPSFKGFITSDKICAGSFGTAVCRGDSGGGLVFPAVERSVTRYYLRGIVSAAPKTDSTQRKCSAFSLTAFTHIQSFESFIIQFYSTY